MTSKRQGEEYRSSDRIDLDDPECVAYWSRELGISEERLRAAVHKVGPMVDEVRGESIGS